MSARDPESVPVRATRSGKPVLIMAVFLILAGTFLFLSNIGLLPVSNPWSFWPAGIAAIGLAKLVDSKTAGERTWSLLFIVLGILFVLVSVGVFQVRLHDGSWTVSILFIALGIAGLSKSLDTGPFRRTPSSFLPPGLFGGQADLLGDSAVLGACKRRIQTSDFRGGRVQAILGAVEIDLRAAQICGPDWIATLELTAVFGSIKLTIPDGWKVATRSVSYLGNLEDKTILQARTIADLGTLVITGYSIGSSVEIEN